MVIARSLSRFAEPLRRNLLFLGAPGVGKGTYATRLAKKWGIPHISTGDMIRAEIKSGSELGAKFKQYNDKGALVPDSLVVQLANKRLNQPDASLGFILDGFPRTTGQAAALSESGVGVDACLSLTLRKDLLIQKLAGRRVCADCGTVYNVCDIDEGVYRFPPLLPTDAQKAKCAKKCANLEQRADDSVEVVKSRLETYDKETLPLVAYYTKMGNVVSFDVKKGIDDLPIVEETVDKFLTKVNKARAKA
eukprot:GHVN01099717.1.p1 GENE.GHVN01099717.1~~GHVN01099717.1.p1  ORF type:complete len:249 (+),score=49.23 GHVN01099717.1:88-834(+)